MLTGMLRSDSSSSAIYNHAPTQLLSIANNALASKSAAELGELLRVNATLTEVHVGWNQIKVRDSVRNQMTD